MSRVGVHEVTREGVTHIVRNLRDRDRREIFALRWWQDGDEQLIDNVLSAAGVLWRVWSWDDEPVAINGVAPTRPGVVCCSAFGTDKWRHTARAMTQWSLNYVVPVLKASKYHRGEAYVLAANTDSRRWIELLGGEVEALLKGFGREQEDFLLYAWDLTREGDSNVLRRWREDKQRAGLHDRHLH